MDCIICIAINACIVTLKYVLFCHMRRLEQTFYLFLDVDVYLWKNVVVISLCFKTILYFSVL